MSDFISEETDEQAPELSGASTLDGESSGESCPTCGGSNLSSCPFCNGDKQHDGQPCPVCEGKGEVCDDCSKELDQESTDGGDDQMAEPMMEDEGLDSHEIRASLEKEAMDNPFGYGPFVSDDPLVSEQYSHDNPANNVGPYTGPSSYSINTVSPYTGEEEENPAQNVGPYMPPSHRNEMMESVFATDEPEDEEPSEEEEEYEEDTTPPQFDNLRAAYKHWVNESGWFDGSSNSVYNRIAQAQVMKRQARLNNDGQVQFELDEQIITLSKVATELDESNLNDYLEELPGGTVALEYEDITDGELVDFGSFISVESSRIFAEAKDYDWEKFTEAGARVWVRERVASNPGLLRHETDTRKAAIDYVKGKTMVLTDPIRRAEVIDEFVTNVEVARREAALNLEETDRKLVERVETEVQKLLRQAKDEVEAQEFSNTVELTPDVVDGRLDLGEDDGSLLYTAAVESLAAMDQDWPTFTTEGAREWFWEKASDGPMWKYEDSTRRAAKDYALTRTAAVQDSAFRNEIISAFCASVEFLRKVYAAKTAKQEVVDEELESYQIFDSVFGSEDEIIW